MSPELTVERDYLRVATCLMAAHGVGVTLIIPLVLTAPEVLEMGLAAWAYLLGPFILALVPFCWRCQRWALLASPLLVALYGIAPMRHLATLRGSLHGGEAIFWMMQWGSWLGAAVVLAFVAAGRRALQPVGLAKKNGGR
ncbi:hypothetical protein FGE12_22485 [Aggregicoccus sp. 17bor-14]|uniref:hypothetical protein n=1 Tax=Myxococcaceae TaxID=31 RepID=UPI00129C7D14|nr:MULTISPECIES: hypothetical protein [Myxococcaceae]MBF5045189.1 hypothetical protein [Simulacricoccus sp. 17bor-14]MRI90930.1 hypothetical protein [Aggregicoccus sp. 17bor-14]